MMRASAVVLACGLLLLWEACGKADPPATSAGSEFQSLFASNCSGCHGAAGRGGASQPLNDPLYLSIAPQDEIRRTITYGRPGTSMPAFAQAQGGPLSSAQIDLIVSGIEHNWRRSGNSNGATPPRYSAPLGNAQNGKAVFDAVCAPCHGEKGLVGPVTDPFYLTLVSDQGLRTTIIVGRPALGMPDWLHQQYRRQGLSDEDISDLVAWLSSLRPKNS